MDKLKAMIEQFLAEEDGATMIEYALLAALVALVAAAALVTMQTALSNKFGDVEDCLAGAGTTAGCNTP